MRARSARPNSGSTASTRGARRRTTRRGSEPRWSGPKRSHSSPRPRVPDDVYERVREQFSEDELVHLSLAVVAITGWNRLNIAARTVPGDYVAGSLAKVHGASRSRSRRSRENSRRQAHQRTGPCSPHLHFISGFVTGGAASASANLPCRRSLMAPRRPLGAGDGRIEGWENETRSGSRMARRTELSYGLRRTHPHRRRRWIPEGQEARNEDDTRIHPDTGRSCRRCRGAEPRGQCRGPAYAGQAVTYPARPRSPRVS